MRSDRETIVFVEYDGIAVYLVKIHKSGGKYRTLLEIPKNNRKARFSVLRYNELFETPRTETPRS